MKKTASALAIIAILFSTTACSSSKTAKEEMYIQKAELTEAEQSILEFVGSEKPPYILDFLVDDTIQSLQINTYELQGTEWKLISGGGGTQLNEPQSRIALTFDNIGLGLRTAVENKGSNSYKTERDFDFEGLSTTTSYLTDKTMIEYEKEIPLVIQIHTSKDTISSLSPEHAFYELRTYANSKYEKVYAITCLFSQKTVNELTEQTAK
ncbi:MAG: hypothetical protein RR514_03590 [Christensenella sp.]